MASFSDFANALGRMAAAIPHAGHAGLEESAKLVESTAKAALGTYEFGWAPLAPSTVDRKKTGDSPLLETGALRDSITHHVDEHHALIGTNDPKAKFLELGTSKMPPRPFLSEAARRSLPEIEHIMRAKVTVALKAR